MLKTKGAALHWIKQVLLRAVLKRIPGISFWGYPGPTSLPPPRSRTCLEIRSPLATVKNTRLHLTVFNDILLESASAWPALRPLLRLSSSNDNALALTVQNVCFFKAGNFVFDSFASIESPKARIFVSKSTPAGAGTGSPRPLVSTKSVPTNRTV